MSQQNKSKANQSKGPSLPLASPRFIDDLTNENEDVCIIGPAPNTQNKHDRKVCDGLCQLVHVELNAAQRLGKKKKKKKNTRRGKKAIHNTTFLFGIVRFQIVLCVRAGFGKPVMFPQHYRRQQRIKFRQTNTNNNPQTKQTTKHHHSFTSTLHHAGTRTPPRLYLFFLSALWQDV